MAKTRAAELANLIGGDPADVLRVSGKTGMGVEELLDRIVEQIPAPVGDPAMGPIAYPHRISASENPLAALGHHQEDSTHIAFNVLTAGLTWRGLRFEQSGFHGGEPGEQPPGHGDLPAVVATWLHADH